MKNKKLTAKDIGKFAKKLQELEYCKKHKKKLELFYIPVTVCPDCKTSIDIADNYIKFFKK